MKNQGLIMDPCCYYIFLEQIDNEWNKVTNYIRKINSTRSWYTMLR